MVGGLATTPALNASVPPPPASDPTRQDITIVVEESYLNRALTQALPGNGSGEAMLDVQPDNRLVVNAEFDLLMTKLKVVITLRLTAEAGQIKLTLESLEAGGQDVLELLGMDPNTLTETVSEAIQQQIEAGLGEGTQLLDIVTDEEHITIMARWVQ